MSVASGPPSTSLAPIISATLKRHSPMKSTSMIDWTLKLSVCPAPTKSTVNTSGSPVGNTFGCANVNVGWPNPASGISLISMSKASTVP